MADDKKYKIFIVDDDTFLIDMYALKFTQSGYDVKTALGPEIAFAELKKGYVPDVMLLDVVMPVTNGFEFLDKVNKENLIPKTLKIMLSNRGQQSDIDQGNKLGAAGYIVKANTTPSEVITKVKEFIVKAGI